MYKQNSPRMIPIEFILKFIFFIRRKRDSGIQNEKTNIYSLKSGSKEIYISLQK